MTTAVRIDATADRTKVETTLNPQAMVNALSMVPVLDSGNESNFFVWGM